MAKTKFYEEIYRDKNILVVNKSAGLPVVPTRDPDEKSLVKILQNKFDKHIYVIHRIDRDTSGLVVFAFDEISHKNLNQQFYKRLVDKEYICLNNGISSEERTTIDKPLGMDSNTNKMKLDSRGKDAITHYQMLDKSKKYSKNKVIIETGRTHQIRVHLASEGHPILGDSMYNSVPFIKLSQIKKKYAAAGKGKEERPLIGRTALHAMSLRFDHPISGNSLKFESEIPKDMRACWNQLKKWDV